MARCNARRSRSSAAVAADATGHPAGIQKTKRRSASKADAAYSDHATRAELERRGSHGHLSASAGSRTIK
jgi:hypothetical protein